jgi:disulfide bond formation protein DsbB
VNHRRIDRGSVAALEADRLDQREIFMADRFASRLPLAALGFVIGLAAILGAWAFQIFGGYVPCKLCLEQRIPYYLGLPVLLIAILLLGARKSERLARGLLVLAGLIFLAGLGLAIYHAGAEWQFWAGPSDCGGGVATTGNAGDLLAQIGKTRVVSCTEAALRVLGLSFAGWNALVSIVVAAAAFRAAFRKT